VSDAGSDGVPDQPEWDDAPVAVNVIKQIVDAYPDWRIVQHSTGGNQAMMIHFADDDGEFAEGLDGDFVSMVAEFNRQTEGEK
jgi:hypothetical protein